MISDEQDRAEAVDDEVISDATTDGERIDDIAAEEDYPPDHPYVVDDQGSVYDLEDDVTSRLDREYDENDDKG